MNRRKYLAAVGTATSLGLAGCSSGTGGNNSSGNGSGGNGSGGESTEAASGDAETEMESGGDSTEMGGDTTESSGDETATESSESSGEESTETSASSGESGGSSSSISDSGETDVSLKSADVADAYSLDSVEYYSEDMSNGVRGEVTNTTDSSISYTGIQVKFYDSDDTRIGETLDNTSDLGAGETYAFDAVGLLTGDKADSVASYTIAISDSAF
jgi:hypothetical protein